MRIKEIVGPISQKSKPRFFSSDKRKKPKFLGAIMRYKNLNKVIVPHVIPMVEESMHSNGKTRGGHTRKEKLQRGG